MPSYASLVVATLPRRRAVSALRGARAAASAARRRRGVECSVASQTSRFVPDLRHLPFAPGRVGVMSWAATPEALDEADGDVRTEFFVRFRVLGSEGTLEGRDPFAGVRVGLPGAAPLPVAEA